MTHPRNATAFAGLGLAIGLFAPAGPAMAGANTSRAATAIEAPSPLYAEVARLDDEITAAFDAHDLPRIMALFSADLEFFHDTGGLQSYAEVRAGLGSLFAAGNGIERELVPGSLEVYPIEGYGAVEVGRHRFCHDERGHEECGTFAFVHVWKRTKAGWKITRVVSYGHRPPAAQSPPPPPSPPPPSQPPPSPPASQLPPSPPASPGEWAPVS
jgi:hypothetical protein